MTNPNDAIGSNAAYGTRTSVNAFNDIAQVVNGRGILSGFAVVPKSGMVVSVGGVAGTRDVAIAEDNLGNRTCLNNRLASSIDVTIPAASVSSDRYDAIVIYANNPAQASDTTPDAPSVCGIIVVSGNSTGVSEAQIRSAITADGGTGSVAYFATLAVIKVAAGTTTITSGSISQDGVRLSITVADGGIASDQLASSAVTSGKIAQAAYDAMGSYSTTETATPYKWIDGKTIYRKVIEFDCESDAATVIDIGNNVGDITNMFCIVKTNQNNSGISAFVPYANATDAIMMLQRSSESTLYLYRAENVRAVRYGTLVLEYTKAS